MAGRFAILTDEHIDKALVLALRRAGWTVVRVVDHSSLGHRTPDGALFDFAAEKDWVWMTRDERSAWRPGKAFTDDRRFKGMLCWPQRHAMAIGDVVRFLEALAEEDDPFAAGIRYIKPSRST